MYADDILLLSPSVTLLQKLIHVVEDELSFLDMLINAKKSMCLRIGSRFNAKCANLHLKCGNVIPWVTCCRYLGIHVVSARTFKCDFDEAKRSLYRSFNAIYGKIGRCASEEVICYLLKTKCLPALMYGLDASPVNAADKKSFDFAIFRICAKIFGSISSQVIDACREAFGLFHMTKTINKCKINFLRRFIGSNNSLCQLFSINAESEVNKLSDMLV
jgi:hypothetical protein